MFKENAYTVFCGTEKTREVGTAYAYIRKSLL